MRQVRQVFAAGHNIFTDTDACPCGLRAMESMQGRLAPLELQGLRGRPEPMAQTAAWVCQAHQERLACKAVPSIFLTLHCYLFLLAGWTISWDFSKGPRVMVHFPGLEG